MHFKGDLLDTDLLCQSGGFLPIGDQNAFPLPFQNVKIFRRPRTGDPVGIFGFFTVTGTTGEADDRVRTEFNGDLHRVHEFLVEFRGDFFIRMYGVAVAGNRGNFHIVFFEKCSQGFELFGIAEVFLGIQMCLAGITTRTDLKAVNAKLFQICEGFFKSHRRKDGRHNG